MNKVRKDQRGNEQPATYEELFLFKIAIHHLSCSSYPLYWNRAPQPKRQMKDASKSGAYERQ
jgi:hypothetical protein